ARAGEPGRAQDTPVLDHHHQGEDAHGDGDDWLEHAVHAPGYGWIRIVRPDIGARGAGLERGLRLVLPDVLEPPEAELLLVEEARVVDAPHVLLALFGGERVVRLGRLPAVDDEIPARSLDVAQELGADVAACAAEELRPLAGRPVDALELRGLT